MLFCSDTTGRVAHTGLFLRQCRLASAVLAFADFFSRQISGTAASLFVITDHLIECDMPRRDLESLYSELDRYIDFATAYRWFDSAALKGQFDAEFLIGLQTYFGVNRRGVGNRERGIKWLKRASWKGHGGAAWFLSRIGCSLKHE
ncbi:hypothetical protein FOZ62_028258 [Perkinsus olseni]|uniref:Uncharacterized protein n=1 Tax=Perkinsus olseni TaxID=32597 RepID=A0A7J6RGF7_PEROL|nr:hypothetical protein FOZ62_028258 [Perkinsus olseni]